MKDAVMKEIHKIKDDIAREHRYNLRAMFDAARKRQDEGDRTIIRLPKIRKTA